MSEKPDETEVELNASESTGASAGTAALALGLARGRDTPDPLMDAFLAEQTRVLHLQAEHLHEQRLLQLSHLRWRRFEDWARAAIRVVLLVLTASIVFAFGAMVWTAAHDKSLVIEAFAVPPDLGARGLTGQVVATQIQDRLSYMLAHTDTIRAPSTFTHNWGDDVKVEIPETGVSVGELYRALTRWLGSETRITGEVYRDAVGLIVAARAGIDAAGTFSGPDTDVDKLIAQAAEHIYRQTQPYRYVAYLSGQGRHTEEEELAHWLALHGAADDKPWAYSWWGLQLIDHGDFKGSVEKQRIAAQLNPNLPHVAVNLAAAEVLLGHDAASLRNNQRALELLETSATRQLASYAVEVEQQVVPGMIAEATGDYREATRHERLLRALPDYSNSQQFAPMMLAADLALDHDVAGSLAAGGNAPNLETTILSWTLGANTWGLPPLPALQRARAIDDWRVARDDLVGIDTRAATLSTGVRELRKVLTWPWLALAEARLGDFAAAHVQINQTPTDCYLCVRVRARIAAAEKNWPEATRWFSEAVRQAPQLPFAESEWGQALLARGDTVGAIEKFAAAHDEGPRYADPLEMWGEALAEQKNFDAALAKYGEADQYAPKWGRLHMKWGESLVTLGRAEEAQKHLALAATLDLSAADKNELATPH